MNLSKVQHEENTELEVTYDSQISEKWPKKYLGGAASEGVHIRQKLFAKKTKCK